MKTPTIFCLLLIFIETVKSVQVYNFFLVNCAQISVKPDGKSFSTLKEALGKCALSSTCNGVQKISETNFTTFSAVFGKTIPNSPSSADFPETYLLDRTDVGPALTNVTNTIDAKMFNNIYIDETCPAGMKLDGSICLPIQSVAFRHMFAPGVSAESSTCPNVSGTSITKDVCDTYPDYMEAEFNSKTKVCTVATKDTVITTWS